LVSPFTGAAINPPPTSTNDMSAKRRKGEKTQGMGNLGSCSSGKCSIDQSTESDKAAGESMAATGEI
jgi:hypothetical protein